MQGSLETRVGFFVLTALAVFVYMGMHVGAFRFDTKSYHSYSVQFKDVSGLSRKAEIKIAGVKVGWIDSINLTDIGACSTRAKVTLCIKKEYALYNDACALVRQDGLIGPKYIELIPGDPLAARMQPGAQITKGVEQVSFDDVMHQFRKITANVEQVSASMREAVASDTGRMQLQDMMKDLSETTKQLCHVSQRIAQVIDSKDEHINSLLDIGNQVRRISDNLDQHILPTVQNSMNSAQDGIQSISSIAKKINQGDGLMGKLINDNDAYADIKIACEGIKNYVSKVDSLQLLFDTHVESMHRPAENYAFEDSKGYLNFRIAPAQDYFFQLQLVTSEKGWVDRYQIDKEYLDCNNQPVDTRGLPISDADRLALVYSQNRSVYTRNMPLMGIQIGKFFKDIALRLGIFENTAGVAVDVYVPFETPSLRWITTLEAFDLKGWNRKEDRRPHLKWLNRMFFASNLYAVFGADDFVSKRNANVFFGFGIRFGDDDTKILLPVVAGSIGSGSGLTKSMCVN